MSKKNEHYGNSPKLDATSQVFSDIGCALHYLPSPATKAKLSRQQRRDLTEANKLLQRIQMSAPEPVWVKGSDFVGG